MEATVFNKAGEGIATITDDIMDFGHSKVDIKGLEQLAGIAGFKEMGDALQDYFLRASQLMAAVINSRTSRQGISRRTPRTCRYFFNWQKI